jgi:hypothetical protein
VEASDYFMIRVQRAGVVEAPAVAGVVERLATGEKRSFQSGDELLRLVTDWPGAIPKMLPDVTAGNAASSRHPDASATHTGGDHEE